MTECDVVVVGAGIGGGALATVLARGGLGGSSRRRLSIATRARRVACAPGVVEARRLACTRRCAAGGHHVTHHRTYQTARCGDTPLTVRASGVLPDIPDRSASVIPDVRIRPRRPRRRAPRQRGVDGIEFDAGRSGRRGCAIATPAAHQRLIGRGLTGLTVRAKGPAAPRPRTTSSPGLGRRDGWPATPHYGRRGRRTLLAFPRRGPGAVIRYALEQHKRLTGRIPAQRFLDAFRLRTVPESEALGNARPAGPYTRTATTADRRSRRRPGRADRRRQANDLTTASLDHAARRAPERSCCERRRSPAARASTQKSGAAHAPPALVDHWTRA
jgi:hypothetical protein